MKIVYELPGAVLTDWKTRVLNHWDTITALSVRRFGSTSLAEEAALAALEGLSKDDWARLKKYKGEASFKSYLAVLVARLFEDFARKRFGRLRPPAWVSSLGGIWVKLFIALCQERLGLEWAVEAVHQGQGVSSRNEVEEAAYTLLGRIPDCGSSRGETELNEASEAERIQEADGDIGAYEKTQSLELFQTLCSIILGKNNNIDGTAIHSKFSQLNISLSSEERLLLKFHFQDGMNVTEAGRMLSLNRFQVHGRLKRLMKKLRAEFDRVGLTEEIRQILR